MSLIARVTCSVASTYVTFFVLWPWAMPAEYLVFVSTPGGTAKYVAMLSLGFLFGVTFLVLFLRDYVRRQFASTGERVFALLLVSLGAVGWFAYLYLYASRPRGIA